MLRSPTLLSLASLLLAGAAHAVPQHPPGTRLPLTLRSELASEPTAAVRRVEFDLAGSTMTFQLQPISIRSADFQLLVQQPGGALVAQTPAAPKTVRGTILELPGSLVAGTQNAEGLSALVIDPNGPDFLIDPDPQLVGSASGLGGKYRLEILPEIVAVTPAVAAPCATVGLCIAELALDTDSRTYEAQNSDPGRVLDVAEGNLNIVSLRLEFQFRIRHHTTAVVVRPLALEDPYWTADSGPTLLGRVNDQWCSTCLPAIRRDAAHLIYGTTFGGNAGRAEVGGMCAVVSGGWSFSALLASHAGWMAHELGHNWGVRTEHYSSCGLGSSGNGDITAGWTCQPAIDAITARRDLIAPLCLDTLIEDLLFADDFEDGDFASWSGQVNPASMAVIPAPAGLFGTKALQLKMDTAAPPWLEDGTPANEPRYRARFYLNRSALELPVDQGFLLFAGISSSNTRMFEVRLRNSAFAQGAIDVRVRARKDDGTWTGWLETAAPDRTVQIEIDWQAATAAGANDGRLALWVDNVPAGSLTGIDNDAQNVDRVRLGPSIGFPSAPDVSGALFVDAFESRRTQFIGPE